MLEEIVSRPLNPAGVPSEGNLAKQHRLVQQKT